MKVLALSSSYEPLGVISWERAVTLVFLNKANTIEEYDGYINSPSTKIKIPAVIAFKNSKKTWYKQSVRFSRKNVWIRDEGICQYCNKKISLNTFTIDHIVPKKSGGKTIWENVVACCYGCNQKKGEKSLKEINFKLIKTPKKPNKLPYIQEIGNEYYGVSNIPESWKFYLERI
jgi:5-methylcytosine-specific restriction endonuclease McrA